MQKAIDSLRIFIFTLLLFGAVYHCLVNISINVIFPHTARGSLLINEQGAILGSKLIGQEFYSDKYFWPRPSHTNYATNFDLQFKMEILKARIPSLDMQSYSFSNLDPHISYRSALLQADRIAYARKLKKNDIILLIDKHTEKRDLGIFGEERVNVLLINLDLEQIKYKPY